MQVFDGFKRFMKEPYHSEMSALDWFCLFGLFLAIVFAWRMITSHIMAELN